MTMFLNSLEQLLRRKLLLVALIASAAFLALYWWGVSSAADAINFTDSSDPVMASLTPADSALAAMFTAGPMVAMLITSLVIVLGASILPDELAAGRMSLWTSLPQTRFRVFLGTTLSPFVASLALGILLFGGTALITGMYFPFRPTSIFTVAISLPIWLMVAWSAVTTLSILMKKIPAMLITFCLVGISSFMGSLFELSRLVPQLEKSAIGSIAKIAMLIFPADRGYRGVLYGLLPRDSMITEGAAFFGVSGSIPAWELAYSVLWASVILALGFWRFRTMDLS
jgi:ABC-type transport system involved in multi-copper enzyme maturation permease subunit